MSKVTEKLKRAEELTFGSLQTIYNNSSKDYQSKVGKYERGDDLTTFGQPIINYTSVMNEFINSVVNLVAFPIFQSHMWNNRLSALKKGNKPYGFDIEDIYTNPTNPTKYNANDFSRIMKGTSQDTISAFYRENRHDVFQKTITKDMLRGAFRDVVAFNEFIDTLVTSIYAGNEIEEYNLTKRALNECYDASMFKTKAIDISTTAGIQSAVEDVKNAYEHFQFPSTAYNNYAVYSGTGKEAKVWSNPDDIVVIATIDTINAMKVQYLAGVFNLSEVEFRNRLILVDNFDWDEYETDADGVTGNLIAHHTSDIQMVVCDAGLFQIYDTIEVSTEFFNAGNLATNYFLHVWQTYGMRPWANALVFTGSSTSDATQVDPAVTTFNADTDSVELHYKDVAGHTVTVNDSNTIITAYDTSTPEGSRVDYTTLVTASYGSEGTINVTAKTGVTGQYMITIQSGTAVATITINIA